MNRVTSPARWMVLARDRVAVGTLIEATAAKPETSRRYRDIFHPLGVGDELRAVLRVGGACWGVLCLLREGTTAFSKEEARLCPAGCAASRGRNPGGAARVQTSGSADVGRRAGARGLDADGALVPSATAAGERWLEELGRLGPGRAGGSADQMRVSGSSSQGAGRPGAAEGAASPGCRCARGAAGGRCFTPQDLSTYGRSTTIAVIIEEAFARGISRRC